MLLKLGSNQYGSSFFSMADIEMRVYDLRDSADMILTMALMLTAVGFWMAFLCLFVICRPILFPGVQ